MFTRAHHLALTCAGSIQSIPHNLSSSRYTLILSSHLHLSLPSGLFPSSFPTKTICSSPLCRWCHMPCSSHSYYSVSFLKLFSIFFLKYKSTLPSLHNIHHCWYINKSLWTGYSSNLDCSSIYTLCVTNIPRLKGTIAFLLHLAELSAGHLHKDCKSHMHK